ncbi:MAG: response regulator transcription factor [Ruminococcaceae bacterium]|nr:response regulator transcription factor [Oscillospiraceae bacterium]
MLSDYSIKNLIHIDITLIKRLKSFHDAYFNKDFDILLIDDNERMSSVEIARQLREIYKAGSLILISQNIRNACEAFTVNAFRFLPKPIDKEDLFSALDAYRKEEFSFKRLIIKVANGFMSFPINEIVYIEVSGKTAFVHTFNNVIESPTPLKQIVEQLPEEFFFLTHRSFVVNFMYIRSFSALDVTMINGDSVQLSRRRKIDFFVAYTNFAKSHSNYY